MAPTTLRDDCPVTFYASLDGLPAFTDYALKGRTYRYYQGKPLWGFGYGLSYSTFKYGPVKLSAESLNAGDPLTATVLSLTAGPVGGDEVVEAYLKTPQPDGPIHSLVGFERISIAAGGSKEVTLKIDPRSLSSVDDQGNRSILTGKYTLSCGRRAARADTGKIGNGIHRHRNCSAAEVKRSLRFPGQKMGGRVVSLPPPCPWVVLKVLQSCENSKILAAANQALLQELGHFLLHAVGLRQRGNAGLAREFRISTCLKLRKHSLSPAQHFALKLRSPVACSSPG